MKRLLIFGYGFTGRALVRRLPGWRVAATSRSPDTRAGMTAEGLQPLDPADTDSLRTTLAETDAVVVAAPPGEDGCPALAALAPLWPHGRPIWIGYLSTTGVYGDRGGGWVREDTPVAPASPEARRRVAAEAGWTAFSRDHDAPLAVFRLPGIYGPGRSALDRVRADDAKRWSRPGHVFSRIHVDDIAAALVLAMPSPHGRGVFNICDDEPAPSSDVTACACVLLGRPAPPEVALDLDALSPAARRFWSESRRVANARAKAALGWRPAYPTYRQGLAAILAGDAATKS